MERRNLKRGIAWRFEAGLPEEATAL